MSEEIPGDNCSKFKSLCITAVCNERGKSKRVREESKDVKEDDADSEGIEREESKQLNGTISWPLGGAKISHRTV